ncbi:MAG TPA: hypothetical protein VGE27_09495 [Gemmatimonas sp.]|uniref:hypothetical protein n=1 Tax=Gemmatimonas sp. TaxID=1962908 RepID=UPI002ED866E7
MESIEWESVDARVLAGVSVDAGADPRHEAQARVIRPVTPEALGARGVLAMVVECRGAPGASLASRLMLETLASHFARETPPRDGWLVRALEAGCDAVRGAARRQRFMRGVTVSGAVLLLHQGMASGAFVGSAPLYLLRGRDRYRLSGDTVTAPLSHAVAVTWAQPFMVDADDRFLLCTRAVLGEGPEAMAQLIGVDLTGDHHPQVACDALIATARQRRSGQALASAMLVAG